MKNYCGILEHDCGCNCIDEIAGFSSDLKVFSLSEEDAKRCMEILSNPVKLTPTISRRERRANERKNKK